MSKIQTKVKWVSLFFGYILLFLWGTAANQAHAHKVIIFAWVEGNTVYTESKFAGGRKAKNAKVAVYDKNGKKLLEGKTDENGEFSFQAPKKTEMKVVLSAGMGHQGEWVIRVADFPGEDISDSGKTKEQNSSRMVRKEIKYDVTEKVMENIPLSPCLNQEDIQRLIDNTLDKKLEPISSSLHRLNNPDHDPAISDIFGGIGYILGLVGVAGFFHSRRKRD